MQKLKPVALELNYTISAFITVQRIHKDIAIYVTVNVLQNLFLQFPLPVNVQRNFLLQKIFVRLTFYFIETILPTQGYEITKIRRPFPRSFAPVFLHLHLIFPRKKKKELLL